MAADPPKLKELRKKQLNPEDLVLRLPHLQPRPRAPDPEWQPMPPLPPGSTVFGRGQSSARVVNGPPLLKSSSSSVPSSPATSPAPVPGQPAPLSLAGSPYATPPSSPQVDSILKARSSPLSQEHKLSGSVESDGEKKSERKHHTSSNPKRDKKEKSGSHERSPSKDSKDLRESRDSKDKKHKDTKKGSDRSTDGKGEKTEKHVHCFVRYHFQGPRKCAICEELVWYVF